MSAIVVTDAILFAGEFDLSGHLNSVNADVEFAEKDQTVFGDGASNFLAGLQSWSVAYEGFLDYAADASDEAVAALNGTSGIPLTISATRADGDVAYLGRGFKPGLTRSTQVGEIAKLTGNFTASSGEGLVRGELLVPKAAKTATGTGTGQQLGAVAAGESVYAALHVFSASGTSPTLNVTVESDDNSGFTSATTRLTFTQATAAGSQWQSLAGAITDTYWRVRFTIGGTSPSFTIAVAVGVA